MPVLKFKDPADGVFKTIQIGAVGGSTGPQGPIGPAGPPGTGSQGPKGDTGPIGPPGTAVVIGADYTIARRASSANIASGTVVTEIPLDFEASTAGTAVRLNSGWLQIAKDGRYHFGGNIQIGNIASTGIYTFKAELSIYRGGVLLHNYTIAESNTQGQTVVSGSGSYIYPLLVGDQLRMRVITSGSSAMINPNDVTLWAIESGAITGPTGPTGPGITGPAGPPGSGGSGGGYTRTSTVLNTPTITAGASLQTSITLAAAYRLFNIASNKRCRIRMYTTTAKQAADVARPLTAQPTGDHGLAFEFIATPTLLGSDIVPAVDGYGRNTPYDIIPVTITNTDTTNQAISITFGWIRTE